MHASCDVTATYAFEDGLDEREEEISVIKTAMAIL